MPGRARIVTPVDSFPASRGERDFRICAVACVSAVEAKTIARDEDRVCPPWWNHSRLPRQSASGVDRPKYRWTSSRAGAAGSRRVSPTPRRASWILRRRWRRCRASAAGSVVLIRRRTVVACPPRTASPRTGAPADRPRRASIAGVILDRSMSPEWLSNTYLIGDLEGGEGAFVDAGGPVAPLLELVEGKGLTITHILLTHHHHDHVAELGELMRALPRRRGDGPPRRAHPGRQRDPAAGRARPGRRARRRGAADTRPHQGHAQLPRGQRRIHRRHAVQGLGRRRARPRPHDLRRPAARRSWTT